MDRATLELVMVALERLTFETLDLTGGAPELNPGFRDLVRHARGLGRRVQDRCNLTVQRTKSVSGTTRAPFFGWMWFRQSFFVPLLG
jgi:hypothetical protein